MLRPLPRPVSIKGLVITSAISLIFALNFIGFIWAKINWNSGFLRQGSYSSGSSEYSFSEPETKEKRSVKKTGQKKEPSEPVSNLFVSDIRSLPYGLELVSVNQDGDKKDWVATFNTYQARAKKVTMGDQFANREDEFRLIDIEADPVTQEPVAYIQRVGKDERIPCRIDQQVFQPVRRVYIKNKSNGDSFNVPIGGTFEFDGGKYKIVSVDYVQQEIVVKYDSGLFGSAQYRRISKDWNVKLDSFKVDKPLVYELQPNQDVRAVVKPPQDTTRVEVKPPQDTTRVEVKPPQDTTRVEVKPPQDTSTVSSPGNQEVAGSSQESKEPVAASTSEKEQNLQTNPVSTFSKPKLIAQVVVAGLEIEQTKTVELVSADTSGSRRTAWTATFRIGDDPTTKTVLYRESFLVNGTEFQLINIQVDRRTKKVSAFIRKTSDRRNTECLLNEPVTIPAPWTKAKLHNKQDNSYCMVSVGTTFQLGSPETGVEYYKVITINANTKQVTVEFESGNHVQFTIFPESSGK